MAPRRVVVTGISLMTPLGLTTEGVFNGLLQLKSGLKPTTSLKNSNEYTDIPSKVVGALPEEFDELVSKEFSSRELRRWNKFIQLGLLSTKNALIDANIDYNSLSENERNLFGVCIGSGIGGWDDIRQNMIAWANKESKRNGYHALQPLFIPKILANMSAGNVSIKFGLRGPNHSVSTACATGAHSIGDAYRFIKDGYADAMVAGAVEAGVDAISLGGFARAKSITTISESDDKNWYESASRPFDAHRSGFVLGEGAGILILEDSERAIKRGAKIYAEVLGYGLSSDAYHITTPHPEASGALRSMQMALRNANKTADDIGYINPHATSTLIGDRIETLAMWKLLGNAGIERGVKIGAVKGHIGHLLGAAGSVEAAIAVLCLYKGIVTPSKNCVNAGHAPGDRDMENADNSMWNFDFVGDVLGGRAWQGANEGQVALSNSFGFGGTNSSLCFGKFM
ncbi:fatty acid synthase [Martiniozyma asiatica (nom. inval.)]|nr:fatty acid synthase [Martiniozyma asiatica]